MGAKNLPRIIDFLIKGDRPSNRSIIIIKNAGRNNQQIWTGTLNNILSKTEGIALSPCVIVIGNVN